MTQITAHRAEYCIGAWIATVEQQVPKLWPAPLVQAHDFAIERGQIRIRHTGRDVLGQVRE